MLHTLDNVCHSWAMTVCRDGLTDANLSESRQQVVRFICRKGLVEPVDRDVFMVVVWTALKPSLRNFDVL